MAHTPESRARALAKLKSTRAQWFKENGPCRECQSWERLELDHTNPDQKVSHTVWSWSKERRELELRKCQPLCYKCHKKKTAIQVSQKTTGRIMLSLRKISDKQVLQAVLLRKTGKTVRYIAAKLGVKHSTIVRLTNAAMTEKNFRSRGIMLGK